MDLLLATTAIQRKLLLKVGTYLPKLCLLRYGPDYCLSFKKGKGVDFYLLYSMVFIEIVELKSKLVFY